MLLLFQVTVQIILLGAELSSPFWDNYISYLNLPEAVTNVFCWNPSLILSLESDSENIEVVNGALLQKKRLITICNDLTDLESHRSTLNSVFKISSKFPKYILDLSNIIPTPLEWAYAMVRSRCFQVDNNWFAMVPIIDIANHSDEPNAL